MTVNNYRLALPARAYANAMLVIGLVLIAIHVGLYLYNYQVEELPWLLLQLFDLDEENNIPTWFSSFLLLNNAFFLYLYASVDQLPKRLHWKLLAAGFLLLALDEVAGLHESFNTAVEFNWAIPGAIVVLLVAVFFVPFLLSLPRRLAALMFVSGVLYVSGVIIVELLSEDLESDSLIYTMAVALEEGLEMLGAWLFLRILLQHMQEDIALGVTVKIS
jgi:hypothetical protein